MACEQRPSKNITSTCANRPVGGIELTVYLIARLDFNPVYDATNKVKVTDFTLAAGKVAYKFTGTEKNVSCGFASSKDDQIGKTYKHNIKFPVFEFDAASVIAADNLDDFIAVVEYKQKNTNGDGVFVGLGLASGLWNTKDERNSNANNGIRMMEFETRDQEGEPYSQYNITLAAGYAATKAKLEASLVAA